jgi:hypothetical protein
VIEAAFTNDHGDGFPEFDGTSASRDVIWNMAYESRRGETAAADNGSVALEMLQLLLQQDVPVITIEQGVIGPAINLGSPRNSY